MPQKSRWKKLLEKLPDGSFPDDASNSFKKDMVYVEMILMFLYEHQQPHIGSQWPILRNFHAISKGDKQWMAKLSKKIPNRLISIRLWKETVERYFQLNKQTGFPLFKCEKEKQGKISRASKFTIKSEHEIIEDEYKSRKKTYLDFLNTEEITSGRKEAKMGETYSFYVSSYDFVPYKLQSIKLPIIENISENVYDVKKRENFSSFQITKKELGDACTEMDDIRKKQNKSPRWVPTIKKLKILEVPYETVF